MVVLTSAEHRLALTKVARFTGERELRGAEYHEARFTGASPDRVCVLATALPPSGAGGQMIHALLLCDLPNDHCTRQAVASGPSKQLTLVDNPSRPLG